IVRLRKVDVSARNSTVHLPNSRHVRSAHVEVVNQSLKPTRRLASATGTRPALQRLERAAMRLPFTKDQFFDVFAAYNGALWPAVVALWLASTLTCVWLATSRRLHDRAI